MQFYTLIWLKEKYDHSVLSPQIHPSCPLLEDSRYSRYSNCCRRSEGRIGDMAIM